MPTTSVVEIEGFQPYKLDLPLYAGDTWECALKFGYRESDTGLYVPYDITNWTLRGDIKVDTKPNSPVVTSFVFVKNPEDTAQATMMLPHSNATILGDHNSAKFVYDVQFQVGTKVSTFFYGDITIRQEVTRV